MAYVQTERDKKIDNVISGILLTVFLTVSIVAFGKFWVKKLRTEEDRLAYWYGVEQAVIEPKPNGCDFLDSPIGSKHCHFDKVVVVCKYGAKGSLPITCRSGELSWPSDQTESSVMVSWGKKEDE